MPRRAYQSITVKKVSVERVMQSLAGGAVHVGTDIGKEKIVTVLRDSQGNFLKAWRAQQPGELRELVGLLQAISRHRPLVVGMESTGTYGDAFRQALCDAGVAVQRVSGKAVKDYAEIFDGVPSNHDGKDAAMIAELAALGKGRAWPYQPPSEWESQLASLVEWMDMYQRIFQSWLGRLEGLLARHWPEATRVVKLSSATLLRALAEYGGPAWLAEDAEAEARLRSWGKRFLGAEKAAALLAAARTTVGVRMGAAERRRMQSYAEQALRAKREVRRTRRALGPFPANDPALARQAAVVGVATACAIYVGVGGVQKYHCAEAYRKAMGLNLKERSSGKYQGKLKITKRGPSLARRWLFFAAMRILQRPPVRRWYEAKKARDGDRGLKAVIAVMRKLTLALYAVGRGETFQPERLFPGRRRPKTKRPEAACLTGGSAPETPGIYRLGATPGGAKEAAAAAGNRNGATAVAPPPVCGPRAGARVGSHRSPILRPGQ
jgi:transposase